MLVAFTFAWLPQPALSAPEENARVDSRMLSHNVFFKLKDPSAESRAALVQACHTYLSGHPGVVFYAAGGLAGEFDRGVNVRDFDVALHLVFADRASHDAYQAHPRHVRFVEENRERWSEVRVFDSWVSGASSAD